MLQLHLSDQQFNCLLGASYIRDLTVVAPELSPQTACCKLILFPLSWGRTSCQVRMSTWQPYSSQVNSLASGEFEWYFRYLTFQITAVIDGWGISCELALRWMSLDLTDEKSTLFRVMAWCRQAASHNLSQWWPRSLLPYGITRPQWVKKGSNCSSGLSWLVKIYISLEDFAWPIPEQGLEHF